VNPDLFAVALTVGGFAGAAVVLVRCILFAGRPAAAPGFPRLHSAGPAAAGLGRSKPHCNFAPKGGRP